ncbi:hypothetical protein ABW21_db0209065 [Orbilia brochopaga]|nr:hypothetical protein ABW21_db0209065 [Drechslerella brochopaga]
MALSKALDAFREANLDDRSALLSSLFKLLSVSEKLTIHKLLVKGGFYFDAFGKLPTEVALQIAEDLPPRDIFSLRRVSKQWKRVLSSTSLARTMIRKHYSDHKQVLKYSSYIESDPFRAFRNLVFRDYAIEHGVCGLRQRSEVPDDWPSWTIVAHPPSLNYALVTCNTLPHYLLVPLAGSGPRTYVPLINYQREALEKATVHAGEKFVVAVTMATRRVIIWNTDGDVIREIVMPRMGIVSIASSENYVVIRNGHLDSQPDYYFCNVGSAEKELQVVQRARDLIADRVEDGELQIEQVNTGEAYLATPFGMGSINDPVYRVNPYPAGDSFLLRRGTTPQSSVASDIFITLGHDNQTTLVQKRFDLTYLAGYQEYDDLYSENPGQMFYYGGTIYCTATKLSKSGTEMERIGLWRSKSRLSSGSRASVDWLPGTDGLGPLRDHNSVCLSDRGFVLNFAKGLNVYEWLDYDGFMEQKATLEQGT